MQSYRELVLALRELELDSARPAIIHASLSAFGPVIGGAEAVLGALLEHFDTIMTPTFTYKTMIVPEDGPPDNAIDYGTMSDANMMAEIFSNDMPADKLMGAISEALRCHHDSLRSGHPILSFAGINASEIIKAQTLNAPLAPIAALADGDGWVILLGVGHKANTSIHLGERLAGRRTFVRWALMTEIVVEGPKFPPWSWGFDSIQPLMEPPTYTG